MRCAQCNQPIVDLSQPCPHCQFKGDPVFLAELAHIDWLDSELTRWPAADEAQLRYLAPILGDYRARRRQLRIQLGLLFGDEEAAKVWPQLVQREAMAKLLAQWQLQGLVAAAAAQTITAELQAEIDSWRRKLEGYTPGAHPARDSERLFFVNAQLSILDAWQQRLLFTGPEAYDAARAPLALEREQLEIKLGLRAVPKPAAAAPGPASAQPASALATASPAQRPLRRRPPAPPSMPFRDRFWRTLLSERTLQALLFLGIFLLFAAALSFVIFGWERFLAWQRVAIPTGFTAAFFALGWHVRTRTELFRSGIALTAIAALLVPIDFYTVYANFDIPPDLAPSFWLLTSLLCLGAYIVITGIVRSRFFGYLVCTAAGSTMLALVELGHQGFGLSLDWRPAALSLLAGGFVLAATAIDRWARTEHLGPAAASMPDAIPPGAGAGQADVLPLIAAGSAEPANQRAAGMMRLRSRTELEDGRAFAFAEPLRSLALLSIAVLMLLTFGWRYIERPEFDTLHNALAVTWFVGALLFGWGAVYYRSRALGVLAAIVLPVAVYLAQASLFAQAHVSPAWHAFGWALLVPLYFYMSMRLRALPADPVIRGHGRTAGGWGVVLLIVAAFWSLLDISSGAAAAASHVVLALAVVLAARWWQRPAWLYAASFLFLSAATFGMSQLGVPLAQMGIGWATLAIAHVLVALRLGQGRAAAIPFARPLVVAGYLIAALAILPSLVPYNADLFIYALANWIGLTAWGARLAHIGRAGFAPRAISTSSSAAAVASAARPGSAALPDTQARRGTSEQPAGAIAGGRPLFVRLRYSIFHWLSALPLPLWLWAVITHRGPPDATLPLALAALAWLMVLLSVRLAGLRAEYRMPWYSVGLLVSIAAAAAAWLNMPGDRVFPITLLLAGALYLVDALLNRQSLELLAAGLVGAWGYGLLLERLSIGYDAVTLALALLAAAYIVGGLATLRSRGAVSSRGRPPAARLETLRRHRPTYSQAFLSPLFVAAHMVSVAVLLRVYVHPLYTQVYRMPWTDEMLAWGAACQLVLGAAYVSYAWGTFKRHWAYTAVWLAAGGGGFVVLLYSTGSGALAAKMALGALAFIAAERAAHVLRRRGNALETRLGRQLSSRRRAVMRAFWGLFHEPLLVTGWLVSLAAIATALVRNLLLLGGGRTSQTWAAVALLVIVALYALSARLFRQERFVWFAAVLLFAPWTILTNLGFFLLGTPSVPAFAVSWMVLAWLLVLAGLGLGQVAPHSYARPLKVVAHLLVPGALLWGMFDVDASRVSFLLAIAFYGLAAVLDFARDSAQPAARATRRQLLRATRFFYPWLGLMPLWALYLLAWLVPTAHQELYGLLLIIFGPLGLAAGQWLARITPAGPPAAAQPALARNGFAARARAYALPANLTGYVAVIFGTLLLAHIHALLALVLLYDAALLLASARIFRQPLWLYPAALLPPLSLALALGEAAMPFNRAGWWLIALAAVYFGLAWTLRRLRLPSCSSPLLIVCFALLALGLPPSSLDRDGALYGYAGAALLYALNAFWLRQPLLLSPAAALLLVPLAILLRRSGLPAEQYGLALLPAAVMMLVVGALLDRRFGARKDFPWGDILRWPRALAERWLEWWALPLYALGFGLAVAGPVFAIGRYYYLALDFLLLLPLFGWAIYAFRLRLWLAAAALAAQLAWLCWLLSLGWQAQPVELALRFVPLTVVTAALALWLQRRLNEHSPLALAPAFAWRGWSHILFFIMFLDIYTTEVAALQGTWAGALVSLSHALLLGVLAAVWLSAWLPYLTTVLGILAYQQWLSTLGGGEIEGWPVALSYLALAYGVAGFGLRYARMRYDRAAAWTRRISPVRSLSVLWEAPLQHTGLVFSLLVLALAAWLGVDLLGWTFLALFGTPIRQIVRLPVAQMVVGVCSVLGLLYVTAAVSYRRLRLGYAAIALLLLAWCVHAFYVQRWDDSGRVQWYALPAGLYLLAIAYLEWQRGNRNLARWLDYAAVLLMLGSLFWQTMLYGWQFALLLGAEGFAAFWWGSARRVRRFLYVGMLGVMLATLAQLLNALQSVNQWIVFGLIGLLVVITAVAIERQLESIRTWRDTLETWE